MKSTLESGQIKVIEVEDDFLNNAEIKQSNVLLLSGHKNENFESYLKKLADNGLLEGKVIAIFSCYEEGTTNLSRYLIKNGYAREIIYFPSLIGTDATKAVLGEIVYVIKNQLVEEKTIEEIIDLAINNAIVKYPDMKDAINIFKKGIKIISYNFINKEKNNG